MWNPAFIPILGPSAFQNTPDELTSACEFFISEQHKLLLLQTRTPCSAALLENYFSELTRFITAEQISEVVVLTSTYSHEQHFIGKNPFEFRANEYFKQKTFDGFTESPQEFTIPGSGFAVKFHTKVTDDLKIPSLILYSYVSEGDNFMDAFQLCERVNKYLKILPETDKLQVKVPISWKFLFGRDVTREIY